MTDSTPFVIDHPATRQTRTPSQVPTRIAIWLCIVVLWVLSTSSESFAATRTWTGNTNRDWTTNSNWVGNFPTDVDIARWNNTWNGVRQARTNSTQTDANQLLINDPTTDVTIQVDNANFRLSGNGKSIEMTNATKNLTIFGGASGARVFRQRSNGGNNVTWDLTGTGPGNLIIDNSLTRFEINDNVNLTINVGSPGGTDRIVDIEERIRGNGAANTTAEIIKTGGGLLILRADNNHTGGTTLSAGTIQVNHNSALGNGASDFTFNGGTLATLNATGRTLVNDNTTIGGSVTFGQTSGGTGNLTLEAVNLGGAMRTLTINNGQTRFTGTVTNGGITKEGAGTLRLDVNSNYAGGTVLNAGTIFLANGGAINDGPVTVNAGTLDLNGTNVFLGASTLTLTGGTISGGGELWSNASGGFDVEAGTISVALKGLATLTKTTGGTVTLSGTNAYTGPTNVNAGELNVTGDISSSSLVTVAAGATLSGSGTVGALSTAGVTSPGDSPGTMFAGNTTWLDGGSFLFEIDDVDAGAGVDEGWDLLDITGTLDLTGISAGGYTIDIVSLLHPGHGSGDVADFDFLTDYTWDFVHTTGGISGFDESDFVLDASQFTNGTDRGFFSIQQNGNNLELTFTAVTIPEPTGFLLGAFGIVGLGLIRRPRT